jgi:hypothetical protein
MNAVPWPPCPKVGPPRAVSSGEGRVAGEGYCGMAILLDATTEGLVEAVGCQVRVPSRPLPNGERKLLMRTAGEPPDEAFDALNEDLSRILLGEGPALRFRRGGPAGGAGDVRHAARLLLEELAGIARKLERTTEEGRGVVRRIEEIAAALLDLLDPPSLERAAG